MLENIQAFIDVAQAGTFSAAAKLHNVAVSSVSRQVDGLEKSLGVALFQRSSRRLLLTDAGEQFLPRAQVIASELADARAALLDAQAAPRGLLSVTAPSAFGRRHIVPVAASFLRTHSLIELDLHLSDQWVDLSSQRADVAVRMGALPDSELLATRLAPLLRVACASPRYLKEHGRPARPEDLLQHSCLTLASARTPSGWWTFPGSNGDKPLAVHGRLRSDDTESLLQAAVVGLGVVHLASWLVHDKLASGELEPLFPQASATAAGMAKKQSTGIYAVRLKGRSHAAKAQLFIAHLKQAFGDVPYWDKPQPNA
ncbi:LysR family transcriptional regulator [Rhodoferax sp. UBA5149]|uniref:LysR family transcriptional regulator n=1 Tax=Rhodoferax sp. UBA5149 TaxID=1947379 RepID=UPI0025CF6D86|nr:LysR family transcriptional regulator [Rhodoferax sp. UBA5149]